MVPESKSQVEARHGGAKEGCRDCEGDVPEELSRERQRSRYSEKESQS